MIVIKLGGSLSRTNALLDCLNGLEKKYQGRAVVIVPGGGAFADQVRQAQTQWRFDDRIAHCMALLAMQQIALLIQGLKPDFAIAGSVARIQELVNLGKTAIWLPDVIELDNAGIESTWTITSDSLAAWLAGELSASELVLVKSAFVGPEFNSQQLAEQGLVDVSFCDFTAQAGYTIKIISSNDII